MMADKDHRELFLDELLHRLDLRLLIPPSKPSYLFQLAPGQSPFPCAKVACFQAARRFKKPRRSMSHRKSCLVGGKRITQAVDTRRTVFTNSDKPKTVVRTA